MVRSSIPTTRLILVVARVVVVARVLVVVEEVGKIKDVALSLFFENGGCTSLDLDRF